MKSTLFSKLETLMTAATFAENNQHDYAMTLMGKKQDKRKRVSRRQTRRSQADIRPQARL